MNDATCNLPPERPDRPIRRLLLVPLLTLSCLPSAHLIPAVRPAPWRPTTLYILLFLLFVALVGALLAWMQGRHVQAEREACRQRAQLESLRDVSLEISAQLDLDSLLNSIVSRATDLLGGISGGLYLYQPEDDMLVWAVSVNDPAPIGTVLRRGEGLGGKVLESRRPLIVDDYREWEGRAAIFENYPYTSVIGVPVLLKETCLGVLVVSGTPDHLFFPDDAELLSLFATQAAIAIRNARLYAQARRELERRRQTETVLRENEERYRNLVELSPVAIVVHIQGRVAYINPAGLKMLGLKKAEEALGQPIMQFVHPEYREVVLDRIRRLAAGEKVEPVEEKLLTPDGDILYAEVVGAPITYRGEQAVLVVVHNVTERVLTEQRLQHYAARLRILREIDQDILTARSPREIAQAVLKRMKELLPCHWSTILVLNRADDTVETLAGWAESETPRRPTEAGHRYPTDEIPNITRLKQGQTLAVDDLTTLPTSPVIERLLAAEVRAAIAVPLLVQGELLGILALGTPQPGGFTSEHIEVAGEISGQLAIAIHQARLHEELQQRAGELATALARQRELDRLKSEFIQNVSHELRTPLAIARGYAELLEDGSLGELTAGQKRAASAIARRTRGLSEILDNFAAILDIEAGLLQPRPVDMAKIVREALSGYRAAIEEARLSLETTLSADLPPVSGDPVHLRRAVDCLLDNAVKFTPAGGRVTVRLERDTGRNTCRLEVSDTGIGIPTEEQERIFERFYQVNGTTTRRYGGTGLGLALAKEIVKAHSGTIGVTSAVGRGSTFTLELPLGAEPDPPPTSAQTAGPTG